MLIYQTSILRINQHDKHTHEQDALLYLLYAVMQQVLYIVGVI